MLGERSVVLQETRTLARQSIAIVSENDESLVFPIGLINLCLLGGGALCVVHVCNVCATQDLTGVLFERSHWEGRCASGFVICRLT